MSVSVIVNLLRVARRRLANVVQNLVVVSNKGGSAGVFERSAKCWGASDSPGRACFFVKVNR